MLEAAPDDWESPDADFKAHVGEVVRVRLGRHLLATPGPARIQPADARALYAKVTGEILGKERQVGTFWYVSSMFKPFDASFSIGRTCPIEWPEVVGESLCCLRVF